MKRLSITVTGRVQGVGYRFFAQEAADALGVSGWVRNTFHRTVELEAQADERTLEDFCSRLREGPVLAHVADLNVLECPVIPDETCFEVRG